MFSGNLCILYTKKEGTRNFHDGAFNFLSSILLPCQRNWKHGMHVPELKIKRPFYKKLRHLVQGWLSTHSTSFISKFHFAGENASWNYEGIGDILTGIKAIRNNCNLPPRSVSEKPWKQVWHPRHKNRHSTDEHPLPHPVTEASNITTHYFKSVNNFSLQISFPVFLPQKGETNKSNTGTLGGQ